MKNTENDQQRRRQQQEPVIVTDFDLFAIVHNYLIEHKFTETSKTLKRERRRINSLTKQNGATAHTAAQERLPLDENGLLPRVKCLRKICEEYFRFRVIESRRARSRDRRMRRIFEQCEKAFGNPKPFKKQAYRGDEGDEVEFNSDSDSSDSDSGSDEEEDNDNNGLMSKGGARGWEKKKRKRKRAERDEEELGVTTTTTTTNAAALKETNQLMKKRIEKGDEYGINTELVATDNVGAGIDNKTLKNNSNDNILQPTTTLTTTTTTTKNEVAVALVGGRRNKKKQSAPQKINKGSNNKQTIYKQSLDDANVREKIADVIVRTLKRKTGQTPNPTPQNNNNSALQAGTITSIEKEELAFSDNEDDEFGVTELDLDRIAELMGKPENTTETADLILGSLMESTDGDLGRFLEDLVAQTQHGGKNDAEIQKLTTPKKRLMLIEGKEDQKRLEEEEEEEVRKRNEDLEKTP